ncbi:MAG TPA: beta-L-arabinofuranosidase domain-containing protein [Ktedonobacteraceae bacterium]|nr:beta-L-arabinofuranosidase domain-containing protein [Ktedonobacteraceae bacterium]
MKNTAYRIFDPVPFTRVTIEDTFWALRLRVNREKTIPHIFTMLKKTGCVDAYTLQWKPGREKAPHQFWDSDVAKWIEAASYSLAVHPDSTLDGLLDEVIALIASAQQPDGYLNPHYTIVEPDKRWTNLRHGHELYCAGQEKPLTKSQNSYEAGSQAISAECMSRCAFRGIIMHLFSRANGNLFLKDPTTDHERPQTGK